MAFWSGMVLVLAAFGFYYDRGGGRAWVARFQARHRPVAWLRHSWATVNGSFHPQANATRLNPLHGPAPAPFAAGEPGPDQSEGDQALSRPPTSPRAHPSAHSPGGKPSVDVDALPGDLVFMGLLKGAHDRVGLVRMGGRTFPVHPGTRLTDAIRVVDIVPVAYGNSYLVIARGGVRHAILVGSVLTGRDLGSRPSHEKPSAGSHPPTVVFPSFGPGDPNTWSARPGGDKSAASGKAHHARPPADPPVSPARSAHPGGLLNRPPADPQDNEGATATPPPLFPLPDGAGPGGASPGPATR